jgi:hypothetical protein
MKKETKILCDMMACVLVVVIHILKELAASIFRVIQNNFRSKYMTESWNFIFRITSLSVHEKSDSISYNSNILKF